jgi:hypothetical protein
MRFPKPSVVIVTGLATLLVVGWIRFSIMNRQADSRLAEITAQSADLANAQAKWTDRIAQKRLARDHEQSPTPANADSAPVPAASKPKSRGMSSTQYFETFLKDSGLTARLLAAQKASLPALYGPFFRWRSLSAVQTAALTDLIAQREAQALDIASASPAVATAIERYRWRGTPDPFNVLSLGLADTIDTAAGGSDAQAGQELLRQNDETFQTAAAKFLGADGQQALHDYERSLPVQHIVTHLAGALASGEDALTEPQMNQLTTILASASSSYQKGQVASEGQIDWTQASRQAAGALTPAQFEMLKATNAGIIANLQFNAVFAQAAGK